jgi:hypothetical protein
MKIIKISLLFAILFPFTISCSTNLHVKMTPPLSAIKSEGIPKKPIVVSYIPPSVNKEQTRKTKAYLYNPYMSETLVLSPYRDSTPVFRKVLNNVYETVVPANDKDSIFASNAEIKYLLSITDIRTSTDEPTLDHAGFMSLGNDYSQNYTIAFFCNIFNRENKLVWKKEIVGTGHASAKEVLKLGGMDNLAPQRALLAAFLSLQKELIKLEL